MYISKNKTFCNCVHIPPFVHNCHGLNLGEYLAMGKEIISKRISNYLLREI
jgi:hypothetical protein